MTDGNVVREVRNRIVNAAVVFSHLKKSEPPPKKNKNKTNKKKKKKTTTKNSSCKNKAEPFQT